MTPSYRNVFDTCLDTRNYFCQVTLGTGAGFFSAWAFAGLSRFAALDQSLAH